MRPDSVISWSAMSKGFHSQLIIHNSLLTISLLSPNTSITLGAGSLSPLNFVTRIDTRCVAFYGEWRVSP